MRSNGRVRGRAAFALSPEANAAADAPPRLPIAEAMGPHERLSKGLSPTGRGGKGARRQMRAVERCRTVQNGPTQHAADHSRPEQHGSDRHRSKQHRPEQHGSSQQHGHVRRRRDGQHNPDRRHDDRLLALLQHRDAGGQPKRHARRDRQYALLTDREGRRPAGSAGPAFPPLPSGRGPSTIAQEDPRRRRGRVRGKRSFRAVSGSRCSSGDSPSPPHR